MDQQNLKSKILESCNERTPDILSKIKNSSEFRIPVKTKKSFSDYFSFKRLSYSLATIFILAIVVTLVFTSGPTTPVIASTITVDINPSVQITLDSDDNVINVTAINADGEEIVNRDVTYRGLSLDDVIEILIEKAYEKGFIIEANDENIILISIDSSNEQVRERLERQLEIKIRNEVNRYAQLVRVIKERNPNITDEQIDNFTKIARNNHISLGKLLLIKKIIVLDETRDLEELKELSVKELYQIHYSLLHPNDDKYSENSDEHGNNQNPGGMNNSE